MKDYSKILKEDLSSPMDSTQSLFMDESTEDLENYLNTPCARSSTVFEEDSECSTMDILSKNIKGKFRKNSCGSKKNKFFKSKTPQENATAVSNEIPVINEAMKKIFKETSFYPQSKQSPKLLKTYSNKNKDKSSVVESFGLPDEPFLSIDNTDSRELDSIDLDFQDNDDCSNVSLLFNSGLSLDEVESSEFNAKDDFRRKPSFTVENISYQGANLEEEVREAFNFEDGLTQDDDETLNRQIIQNAERKLTVSIENLDLDDIRLFEKNDLSPSKNRKQLLLERLQNFTYQIDNFQTQKRKSNIRSKKLFNTLKSDSRRSTRSKNSTSVSNSSEAVKAISSPPKLSRENKDSCNQNNKKECEEKISMVTSTIDVFSPRRSSRRCIAQSVISPAIKRTETKTTIYSEFSSDEKIENDIGKDNFEDTLRSPKNSNNVISVCKTTRSSKKVDMKQAVKASNEGNIGGCIENIENSKEIDSDEARKDANEQEKNVIAERLLQETVSPQRQSDRLKKKCTKFSENQTVPTALGDGQLENDSEILNSLINEELSGVIVHNKSPVKKRRKQCKLMPLTEKKSKPSECSDAIQISENKEIEFSKSPRKDFSVKNHLNNVKNGKIDFEFDKEERIPDNSCNEELSTRRSERRKSKHESRLFETTDHSHNQQYMKEKDETVFEIEKCEEQKVIKNNLDPECSNELKTNEAKPMKLFDDKAKFEKNYKGDIQTDIRTSSDVDLQTENISDGENNSLKSKPSDNNQDNVNNKIQTNISDKELHEEINKKNNKKESDHSKSSINDPSLRKSHRLLAKSDAILDNIADNEASNGQLVMKMDSASTGKIKSPSKVDFPASIIKETTDVKDMIAPVKRRRGRPPKLAKKLAGSFLSSKSPENSNTHEKPNEMGQKIVEEKHTNSKNSTICINGLVSSPISSNSCEKISSDSDDIERTSAVRPEKEEMKFIQTTYRNENESIENKKQSDKISQNDEKNTNHCESLIENKCNQQTDTTENKNIEKQICVGEKLLIKKSPVDKKEFKVFTKTEGTFHTMHKYDGESKSDGKMSDIAICTQPEYQLKNSDQSKVNEVEDCEIKDDREVTSIFEKSDSLSATKSPNMENREDSEILPEETDNKNGTMGFLDFGYDINRRTSFRKILEKVMEASRLEMEKSEALRSQRCKSVPNDGFETSRSDNELRVKAYSADSKSKFLKDKRNSFLNMKNADLSRVKKRLNYNMELTSAENNFSMRKRTRSMHARPIKHQNLNPIIGSKNDGQYSEINNKTGNFTNNDISNGVIVNCEDAASSEMPEKLPVSSEVSNEDLEVENLITAKTNSEFREGRICKSLSEGSRKRKLTQRSKSVMGKRFKTETRAATKYRPDTPFRPVKKVYDFKLGDIVWSKIGTYPYWPGMIVEDPETSEFKKFRLLRSTPYYHVRFFGDKGKRAWTIHCLPYEGPDDLDVLREECRIKGHGSGEYYVKISHKEKWNRAVKEAELIKNEPVEKRMGFFKNFLQRNKTPVHMEDAKSKVRNVVKPSLARSKSLTNISERDWNQSNSKEMKQVATIPMKVSSIVDTIESVVRKYSEESEKSGKEELSTPPVEKSRVFNESLNENSVEKTDNESKSCSLRSPLKRSISMKDMSVLSCVDHLATEYCSTESTTKPEKRKTRQSEEHFIKNGAMDDQTDTGLELLDIPMPDLEIITKKSSKNQNSPNKEIKINTTPTSSRKDTEISLRRSRSKSSLSLGRRYSQEYCPAEKPKGLSLVVAKERTEVLCSPRRMRLKRRTIGVFHSSGDIPKSDEFLNKCVSRLPEYKKNLFRGVPKDRVCQICEKSGDVVKCRGPCNGDFHIQCIEKSLKDTEKSTLKETELVLNYESNTVSLENDLFIDNKQVEISTVASKKTFSNNVNLSPFNRKIPLMEQFDRKMKEMMNQVESRISVESNESSSEEIDVLDKSKAAKSNKGKNTNKRKSTFKHVTADDVSEIVLFDDSNSKAKSECSEATSNAEEGVYKCPYCVTSLIPPCFVCNSVVSKKGNAMRQRCSLQKCGKYYHLECLNAWHQTQWSFILHDKRKTEAFDSFVCPRHSCHICTSENSGFSMGRCPNDKLVKCLRCPATYHNSYHCVPAGTEILTSTQIICPRHVEGNKKSNTLNTIWCFVCSEGGNLICCETCPTSVHSECLPVNLLEDDTYICEDCESGRFPLYDEVVWVKCGTFRWWPAVILFPSEVPPNVESKPHCKGEFVVKFFGTYNYFWVGRGRAFLYQEGDTGCLNSTKNKIDEAFSRALREAADVYSFKKGLRAKKQKEVNNGLKPPPYVRIKVNRPVGNVKVFEGNLSNTTPCDCDPKDRSPCGPDSNCLNRILLTECNPEICPAGQRCKNQCFEKRAYPQLVPYRTASRGWGLKTLEPIKKGRFVIEYVGEIIDDDEYQRRITRMHQQKDENYYFLTIDKDRMLDAGPKGNVARFMNHSCQPNCETQKWTVNGDTRVGLFAIEDIAADSELTFNYNLECVGKEKKICRCGAPNCSGFIGVKPVNLEEQRPLKKNTSSRIVGTEKPDDGVDKETCFICGKNGDLGNCSNKTCLRSYHLECVQLDSWPNGKWICPSHACNICSKRTSRICVLCNNSYCPFHSDGKIRYDDSVGFLCNDHEQTKKRRSRRNLAFNGNVGSTSASEPGTSLENEVSESVKFKSSRSERYKKRTSCLEADIPLKRRKLEK